MYDAQFTKQAEDDAVLIERAGRKPKSVELIGIVKADPFQNPPHVNAL
jgi:Txe/YoeB family toxin of Txe-Axe toxin-antitoxin module